MQVGAENLPVETLRAIAATIVQLHSSVFQRRSSGYAGMDFVATDLGIFQRQTPAHIAQLLLCFEQGFERQQTQTGTGTRRALEAQRIVNLLTKHLYTATDPQHFARMYARSLRTLFEPGRIIRSASGIAWPGPMNCRSTCGCRRSGSKSV